MRRSRGRRLGLLIAGGVVVAGAAGIAATGVDLGGDDAQPRSTLPPETATVTRATLTKTERVTGTLGYGDPLTLAARGAGTVTWLPAEGSTITRGQPVYRRDDRAVPLWYGTLPFYRSLSNGAEGADVKQLEQNLSALGYDGFTVDASFTAATGSALAQWQSDLELPESGRLDPGLVVTAPAAIRVAEHRTTPGSPASGPILTYTGTARVVEINLDVAKQHLVHKGVTASVTLPDETVVDGTVTSVGTVARITTTGQQATTTIDVVVELAEQKDLGSLDAAPVSVSLVSQTKAGVLTVPVAALLALSEGGYGVQVIHNGQTSYVAVTTGLFADGRVEVSGPGIAEGMIVGMPS